MKKKFKKHNIWLSAGLGFRAQRDLGHFTGSLTFIFLNFFFKSPILFYLFIRLCQVLVAACELFVAVHGFSSCGMKAKLPRSMQDLSSLTGIKPTTPALEGGFFTTRLPGKFPLFSAFKMHMIMFTLSWEGQKSHLIENLCPFLICLLAPPSPPYSEPPRIIEWSEVA